MQTRRGTLLVGFAFALLAGYAGCAKAPPQKSPTAIVSPPPSATAPESNEASWKDPEERIDVVGAPLIALDTDTPTAHSPFSLRWENLPAVSPDGKTIAAIVDGSTLFTRPRLELIDAATGAKQRTIDFQDGPKATRWREGDAPEGFAREVIEEALAQVRRAHEITTDFTPLRRSKLDVSSLYDALGKSVTTNIPFALKQEAAIDAFDLDLVDDRLTLRRYDTTLVERKTAEWNRSSAGCASKPAVSEIAIDEGRGRAVVVVHHLNLKPGEICSEPDELRVVAWSPARS